MSDRKVELVNLKTTTEYIADMQIILRGGTLMKRKAFIRSFVKEVRVTGDEVVLTYTMPTAQWLLEEAIPVLPIVNYGGR